MPRGGRLGEITGRKWEIINILKGSPLEETICRRVSMVTIDNLAVLLVLF